MSASSIHMRVYEPKDHASVIDVFVAAIRQYPENRNAMQPHWQRLIDESIKSDLSDIPNAYMTSGGCFWVATTIDTDGNEVIVGSVALCPDEKSGGGELRRMSVHPSYHRRGIGRRLVETLEAWAKDHGMERVWLMTGKPVVDAQRFYESVGYQYYESKFVPIGVELLCYEKRLV